MVYEILQDAVFAAVAAVGFASISNPPRRAYLYCAMIAAAGHSLRYLLMDPAFLGIHIVAATTVAAFVVGVLAVLFSPLVKTPPETCLFPALLPMIPGTYAYKAFGGLAMSLFHNSEAIFNHYYYLFTYNGFMCLFILLGMVVGAVIPIFMLKHISFQSTRN